MNIYRRILILWLLVALPVGAEKVPEVFLQGAAVECMEGCAVLLPGDHLVYIDGLTSWPRGYYQGESRGKKVICRGQLSERYDLPVFEDKPGQLPRQGIPVSPGTDLHNASHRYVLMKAHWEEWSTSRGPLRALTPVLIPYPGETELHLTDAVKPKSLAVLTVPPKVPLCKINKLIGELRALNFAQVRLEFGP